MDDLRPTEEVKLIQFLDACNELLSRYSQADTFLYEWIDMMEDIFGFSPILLHLPLLGPKKVYSSNSQIERDLTPHFHKVIGSGSFLNGMYIYQLFDNEPTNFIAVTQEVNQGDLLSSVLKYLPFYLTQIYRSDSLTRKLKMSQLQNTLHEIDPDETTLEEGVESILDFLGKDVLFFYPVDGDHLLSDEKGLAHIKPNSRELHALCKQAEFERNMITREEYLNEVKGLILYPVFAEDELSCYVGTYSHRSPLISSVDLGILCEISANPNSLAWIQNCLKKS